MSVGVVEAEIIWVILWYLLNEDIYVTVLVISQIHEIDLLLGLVIVVP